MFIRSSTSINDSLIAVKSIERIFKGNTSNAMRYMFVKSSAINGLEIEEEDVPDFSILIELAGDSKPLTGYIYESLEARDKAFDELCEFLNCNYKLRDFT